MDSQLLAQQVINVQIGSIPQSTPPRHQPLINSTQPIPHTLLYYLQKLTNKLPITLTRTPYCKHRGTCICSCIQHCARIGIISYLIKVAVSLVLSLKKIKKNPINIILIFINKDSIKFGLFICGFLVVMRGIICGLRRVLKTDCSKYVLLIAGLIGGTASAFILNKKTRQTVGLFLIARAFDITYRSLVQKKILPQSTYFYPFLYGAMMFVTGGYGFGVQPAAISPQLHRFYQYFTAQLDSDEQMRRIWIERHNRELIIKGFKVDPPLNFLPKSKAAYQRQLLNKK